MKENRWREMVMGNGEGGLTEELTVEQRLQGNEGLKHVDNLGKSFLGRMSRSAHLDEGVTRCVCCAPQLCTCKQRISPRSSVFTLFALSKDPELGSLFVLLLNLTTPPSFHYLHLLLLKCLQGPRYAVNT